MWLWSTASFLIVISFGSTLRSHLIAKEYGQTIKNLEELLNELEKLNNITVY